MAADANLALQASVTKTATFSSTGVAVVNTPRRGLYARVVSSNISCGSGSATLQYSIDVSYDSASTWKAALFEAPSTTITTTAAQSEIYIPFEVSQTDLTKPVQVRLVATISGTSGSGHTITYFSDVVLARPE